MLICIKGVYINAQTISILARKENSVIVDLAYSAKDEPIFLTFEFDSEEEAEAELQRVVAALGIFEAPTLV